MFSDRLALHSLRGGIYAGLVLAVEHAYVTQILGAFLAFATVFWTEWVRDHFKRKSGEDAPEKPKRKRKRKLKVAV